MTAPGANTLGLDLAGLSRRLRLMFKACTNIHRRGPLPDIFLFATPRSGSTWLMEIIASQPGFKYYDEPLNPRRENVAYGGLFPNYEALMPESGKSDQIVAYLQALQRGRHRYMNPPPFRRNHRLFTNRIVFKIHEIEHLMDRIKQQCGGLLVYLLRHPISNSISRTVQPRLGMFLRSPYYAELIGDSAAWSQMRDIATGGSQLQRSVISWCFENLVMLRVASPIGLVVTYEELVLNPSKSCDLLMSQLQLPHRGDLIAAFDRPATNIGMSRSDTIDAMSAANDIEKRQQLVIKWQRHVTERQCREVDEVMDLFRMNAYTSRHPLAADTLLHFPDTPLLLGR